jgi:hypothetical protein
MGTVSSSMTVDFSVKWQWNAGSTEQTDVDDTADDISDLLCNLQWPDD